MKRKLKIGFDVFMIILCMFGGCCSVWVSLDTRDTYELLIGLINVYIAKSYIEDVKKYFPKSVDKTETV